MRKCDVLIIGGGPGGYVAAIKAAQLGKNVTLIEKEHLGGTCLNWGCIPMKALIRNAEVIDMLNNGDTFGFEIDSFKTDYSKAYARSREVSNRLSQGIKYLMKKNGVEVIFDEAVVQKDRTIHLKSADKDLQAENIIIAAGAQPAKLHIFDYSDPHVLDSRRALALDTAPKSVCIIGGGAIGLEFASVWNAYGAKVTIIEMLDRLLPQEDEAVSSAVQEVYSRNGIEVLTHTTVTGTKSAKNKIVVSTNETDLECEYVLVSVGIKPNSCFDNVGIQTDQRGYVIVDDFMRTNIEGIYAIGDITGKLPLAHTASAQGIVAAKAISGLERHLLNYDLVPRCTYGIIEIASVGITENQAKQRNTDYDKATFPLSANGKTLTNGSSEGFATILYGREHKELLGVSLVGTNVTEIIAGAASLIQLEATLDEVIHMIYPHPTVSEVLYEVAHLALGEGIHY